MAVKNPKDLLVQALKFPEAIEEMLPEGAPKFSEILTDVTGRLPDLPDFPIEAPDLPEPPKLPEVGALGRKTRVRVTPEVERPAAARKGRTRFLY